MIMITITIITKSCMPPYHILELSQTLISPSYIYMGGVIWSQGIVQMGSTAW